ncbi:ABC transporter substrate-binding protein [Paenibacillus sp. N3.4]|uniref:ABC transporter substrate-binding protein n=1 Tax=Paenibacillus sp. N3.4 TaxID=2603222 RepID=UPI0011C8F5A6|nr:ABC transporter substrate-binding protein [Paenibacillus sp. N3.4]TXK80382.1 carbohydrate ABC transporter substrate-binding protein [Paenibacillus sp. N3.4]
MKKWMKVNSVALTAVMAVTLSGCGAATKETNVSASPTTKATTAETTKPSDKPSNEIVKLRISAQHFDDDTSKPYDYAAAELKKEMPNVELLLEPTLQDDNQKLKTQMATGDLPDIVDMNWNLIQIANKSNNILVLDKEAETEKFKKDLLKGNEPKLIAPDGHVYGYPYGGIEFQIIYYNKKIFADAGVKLPIKTVDELKEAAKVFTAKGITPMAIFGKEKWIGNAFLRGFMVREDPKGFGVLNEAMEVPEALKLAAKQVSELQAAGLFAKNATNTNYDQASASFYQGKAAMFVNGQWEISSSQKNLGDNVDWMYWPAKDEATYEKSKFMMDGQGDATGFVVSSKTKDKATAIKVAAFMARKYAEYKYTMVGNPIVSVKVDKPVQVEVPAMLQRLSKEIIPNVTGYAAVLSNTKIGLALDDNSQNLLVPGFSVDQFVSNMNKALKDK